MPKGNRTRGRVKVRPVSKAWSDGFKGMYLKREKYEKAHWATKNDLTHLEKIA